MKMFLFIKLAYLCQCAQLTNSVCNIRGNKLHSLIEALCFGNEGKVNA